MLNLPQIPRETPWAENNLGGAPSVPKAKLGHTEPRATLVPKAKLGHTEPHATSVPKAKLGHTEPRATSVPKAKLGHTEHITSFRTKYIRED